MDAIIEFLKVIVIGVIQGITEWLPISSTGHMLLFNSFFPLELSENAEFWNMFLVVIQLGSIMAVLLLYFNKLNPFSKKKSEKQKKDTFDLWLKVLVASVPAAVLGLLFNDVIEEKLSIAPVIAVALVVYGVFFILIENRNKEPKITSFKQMTYQTAFMIGMFQVLALIPGTSRSGSTILGAVLLGTSRYVASEFSFFCAIPVMFGASGLKILKMVLKGVHVTGGQVFLLVVGTLVAFIVSLFVIKFLMSYIKKHDFKIFGVYRIALGIFILFCLYILQLPLV